MTDEWGRPGTCKSKVGCEAIDEPCTKRMVPAVVAAGCLRQRKSLTSPLRVQCSVPFMPLTLKDSVQESAVLGEELGERGHRGAGHFSEAAHVSRQGTGRAAGHPREGSRHLANLDLERLRRRSALPCLRL